MSHGDTIRAAYDAWNRDDVEGYLGALRSDIEIHPGAGRQPGVDVYRGHDGAIRWMVELIDRGERPLTAGAPVAP